MRQLYLLPLICLIVVSVSCKKENNNPIKDEGYRVVAGKIDDVNIEHITLNPEIVVKSVETGCHTYQGIDSADLNFDSKPDINLFYYLNNDILMECCYECSASLDFKRRFIITNKDIQITVDANNYVNPVELGDTIDSKSNWSSDNILTLFESFSPEDTGRGYFRWWNIKDDKLVGTRYIVNNDTLYGWIKINASETIILKEIALKKAIGNN